MASDRFVSRGGDKLQAALEKFDINPLDYVVMDVGSSTGGFVDCLLQNKAEHVYAVDTAYGELAWKLRNDHRVTVLERTNILDLEFDSEKFPTKMTLITVDAGWTKLEKVIPRILPFLKYDGFIIALLKPHYEASKKDLVKGVLPKEKAEQVKDLVLEKMGKLGLDILCVMESPILGGGGNLEYLVLMERLNWEDIDGEYN